MITMNKSSVSALKATFQRGYIRDTVVDFAVPLGAAMSSLLLSSFLRC